MGDAGEGLIDADARIQERMEELERERAQQHVRKPVRDPEQVRALESLRLARTELERQLGGDDARTAPRADRSRRSKRSTGGWRPGRAHAKSEGVTAPSTLSRRHQAPLPPLRPVARLSRLGVAAESLSLVRGAPAIPLFPRPASARRYARSPTTGSFEPPVDAAAALRGGDRRRPAACARPVGVEAVPRVARGRCASTRRAATSIRPKPTSSPGRLPALAEHARGLSLRARSARARAALRVRRRRVD